MIFLKVDSEACPQFAIVKQCSWAILYLDDAVACYRSEVHDECHARLTSLLCASLLLKTQILAKACIISNSIPRFNNTYSLLQLIL